MTGWHADRERQATLHIPQSQFYHGPFGRLFRKLPPWHPRGISQQNRAEYLIKLADEAFTYTDTVDSKLDNKNIPAGYTYFGQFIDHDLTFDPTTAAMRQADPDKLQNYRTPRLDLDCVYGAGPRVQPYLYEYHHSKGMPVFTGKFRIGQNQYGEPDLPRIGTIAETDDDYGRWQLAVIGDPRNDENIIVSQLHLAIMKFHNRQFEETDSFTEAQRLTRWHYQWVVIHDFLKRICGAELVEEILTPDILRNPQLKHYEYKYQPYMPVEFSVAAYRFGHSQIRPRYQLNEGLPDKINIFGKPENSLQGGRELPPNRTIQWNLFVPYGKKPKPQTSQRIGTTIAQPLQKLPIDGHGHEQSLVYLDLLRGWHLKLPSGQSVSAHMGINPINRHNSDPLWLYILREAEHYHNGKRLGPVAARIVAEVFIGLLLGDPHSYLSIQPNWTPTHPTSTSFNLSHFLHYAGMPMTKKEVSKFKIHSTIT